jgi:hypothetical protein
LRPKEHFGSNEDRLLSIEEVLGLLSAPVMAARPPSTPALIARLPSRAAFAQTKEGGEEEGSWLSPDNGQQAKRTVDPGATKMRAVP